MRFLWMFMGGLTLCLLLPLLATGKVVSSPVPDKPTWAQDVAPILNKNCVSCHRPGEVAPFSLLTYQDAFKHAQQIVAVTGTRYMPPWKAEPGHGEFVDARRLSDTEIQTLAKWAKEGAPAGDLRAAPKMPDIPAEGPLGKPDLVVKMSEVFTIPADAERDVYKVFVAPIRLPANKWVKAVEFRPGNRRVVHHAFLFMDTTGQAQALDAKAPGAGYTAVGGVGFNPSGGFGAWTPGTVARPYPEGVARQLPKECDLLFQIHYSPSGKPETDQSTVAFYFTDTPPNRMMVALPIGSRRINIPPGEKAYVVRDSMEIPVDVELVGLIPHAHFLCKEMRATATLPNGTKKSLLWIRDWDFNWQGSYRYAMPIELPAGSRVEMVFTYDNSSENPRNPSNPPKRVTWGENTTDEMAGLNPQVIPKRISDMPKLRDAIMVRRSGGRAETAGADRPAVSPATQRVMLQRFDHNGNGRLDPEERKAVGEFLRQRRGGNDSPLPQTPQKPQKPPSATPNTTSTLRLAKPMLDVDIVVRDREKSKAFYGEIIGLTALPAEKGVKAATVQTYAFGETHLRLLSYPTTPAAPPSLRPNGARGFRILTLVSPDSEGIIQRARAKGYTIQSLLGGRGAIITDPDGVAVECLPPQEGAADNLLEKGGVMVGLIVGDAAAARAFYGKALGMSLVTERNSPGLGTTGYYYQFGKTIIKFWGLSPALPGTQGAAGKVAGLHAVVVTVPEPEVTYHELVQRGLKPLREPQSGGFSLTDPDGNRFVFRKP